MGLSKHVYSFKSKAHCKVLDLLEAEMRIQPAVTREAL